MDEDDDDEGDGECEAAGAEWRLEPSSGVLSRREGRRLSESRSELMDAEVLAVELDRMGGSLREAASVGETRG